jgi:hypothetical protein
MKIEEKYFTLTSPADLPQEITNNPKAKEFLDSLKEGCKVSIKKDSNSIIIKTEDKDIKINLDEL